MLAAMEPFRSEGINPTGRRVTSTIEGLGEAQPPAMIAKKVGQEVGEGIVASGALVPRGRAAGLERAARLAGEAFGHEDATVLPRWRWAVFQPMLLPALICGFSAAMTLSVLVLR